MCVRTFLCKGLDRMKIIFMGTPAFSVPILERLVDQFDVCAVVTQPDRPVGRKRQLTPPPVKLAARAHEIPVLQPARIRTDYEAILQLEPDLIVTAAYGQIVPKAVLDAPRYGCINVHASLLPKYRGGAPIHQAIIDGEQETGITIMYMTETLDAGDMLSQRAIPIEMDDDVESMHNKLSVLGADLLLETMGKIEAGTVNRQPQDHAQATFAPNIRREQERINWSKDATALANQVRGMRPWPVAYTTVAGKRMKIWASQVGEAPPEGSRPGEIVQIDATGIDVACGEHTTLRLTMVQPEGKKAMAVQQFLQSNHGLTKGAYLGGEDG